MTQEEKQLLLKDLCTRLPYGVIAYASEINKNGIITDVNIPYNMVNLTDDNADGNYELVPLFDIKPYLRPMSSMTEEEKKIMRSYGFELIPYDTGHTGFANIENCIDEASFRFMEEFLNAHYFDYRDLIPMGLALEAKEGMYKTE